MARSHDHPNDAAPPSPPPQSEAGIDRAGTGHGGPANASDTSRPDADDPSSQRPGDQEGPVNGRGAQEPPDPRVSTAPPDTEHGDRGGQR